MSVYAAIKNMQEQRQRSIQRAEIDYEVAINAQNASNTSSSTPEATIMDAGPQGTATTVSPLRAHDMLQLTSDPAKLAIAKTNTKISPLLCLPAELRNQIYNLVLTTHTTFDTSDAPRRKQERHRRGQGQARATDVALLEVCGQLYSETRLLPFSLNPLTFTSLPFFSKYLAQTLLPNQIAAIKMLKCPLDEIYFSGYGLNSAFLGLIKESFTGLRVLVVMGAERRGEVGEVEAGIALVRDHYSSSCSTDCVDVWGVGGER